MKTIPMIFNTDMVKALLDGRKTVTRRPLKVPENWQLRDRKLSTITSRHPKKGKWGALIQNLTDIDFPQADLITAPASAGDLIYVRETWAEAGANAPELTLYKANYPEHVPAHYENVPSLSEMKWTPSIHMPRRASRLTLKVADVRIETMKELRKNQEQISREGFGSFPQFRHTWREIYGQCEPDDLVWVIEFEVVKQNVDNYLKQSN